MGIGNALLFTLYGGLWRAATPVLRRHKRLRDGFAQRLVPQGWPFAQDRAGSFTPQRLWVQAASGGEARLVHSLAPALARVCASHPRLAARPLELLCTTCTRQGLDVLEQLAKSAEGEAPGVLPRYLPLDRPDLMQRAMALAAPRAVILLETELWPGLMLAARRQGVPVLTLNGRMTEKSLAAYRLAAPFWRAVAPSRVLAVSEDDARRFARLFGPQTAVSVMPNIKFDSLAAGGPPPAFSPRKALGLAPDALLAVFASVREEEEGLLLPVLAALHGRCIQGSPVALALAPRHMHRVQAWQGLLERAGLPFTLRSRAPRAGAGAAHAAPPPVCLWDSFGELQTLYAAGDAVFVGGSLAPLGGQNFLEPAGLGLPPLVGPHLDNFLWVGEDFFGQGLGRRIDKAEDLSPALEGALAERAVRLLAHMARPGPATDRQAARAALAKENRERFLAWLAPHTGGSVQAAMAAAEELLLALFPAAGDRP